MGVEADTKTFLKACATNMFVTCNVLNVHEGKLLILLVSGGELTEVSSYIDPSLHKGKMDKSH